METDLQDCVIVGGGPAGLTAALYLARFLRQVTICDAQDARAALIPRTHNLAAFPDGIAGPDLLNRMRAHAQRYGALRIAATVHRVEPDGPFFRVIMDRHVATTRTVIFATGVFNHRPPLVAKDHDTGLAHGLIRYCPVCDAFEVSGKHIAVLGDGTHGAKEAAFISHYSPHVTLIPVSMAQKPADPPVATLSAPLHRLSLTKEKVIVTLHGGAVHQFDTLYVALGSVARSDATAGLGLHLTATGHIAVDSHQRTSMTGVYAIGDVTDGLDQIAVAMGQAATAATAVHNTLSRYRIIA